MTAQSFHDPDADPDMLYDDSPQEEFREQLAELVAAVRWDLDRYLMVKGTLEMAKDWDDPLAVDAHIMVLGDHPIENVAC